MILAAICAVAFVSASLLILALRRYALRHKLIDVPNERRSHTTLVPRGGGVAIVLTFLASTLAFLWGALDRMAMIGMLVSGGLVATIGFLDDHVHVPAGWRLLIHFAAAAWALAWIGGLPPVPFFGDLIHWGVLGDVLAAVYLVWLLNLYNFMDGIDGIAGVEAITVACCGAFLSWQLTGDARIAGWLLVLAAAVGGFLVWNFPIARIFMGDAGSGFLGFVLGVFSVLAAWQAPQLFWSWVILLGVFVVDATMTLLRRMARREALHEPHRCHAYQYASRRFGSHRKVTLAVGVINLAWLFPFAWAVALQWLDGLIGVLVSYLPLVWLAWHLHAGARERQAE